MLPKLDKQVKEKFVGKLNLCKLLYINKLSDTISFFFF